MATVTKLHYWQYFVALEADLAATARFVEPTPANMACYSVEFARILLTAGSEVDVLCKVLCQEHQLPVRPVNIDGYRAAITARFPNFTKLEIRGPATAWSACRGSSGTRIGIQVGGGATTT